MGKTLQKNLICEWPVTLITLVWKFKQKGGLLEIMSKSRLISPLIILPLRLITVFITNTQFNQFH